MNVSKILVTDFDRKNLDIAKSIFDKSGIEIVRLNCIQEDEVISQCQGYPIVITQYAKFTENVLSKCLDMKVIVRYGVGVDNVDLQAAKKYGIKVCNVPDYGVGEVADHAMALYLTLARKIAFNNQLVRKGVWKYDDSIPIYRLSAQTIGVIGLGRIGYAFAQRAMAFGAKVIAFDSYLKDNNKKPDKNIELVSFDELIEQSNVISIHCPLDGNRDLISSKEFQKMKNDTILINVSRGGIINEDALYEALVSKKLSGAGCDVVSKEPIDMDSKLLTLENFIVTPHIAGYSEEASEELERKVAEEALRGALGQELKNHVNP